MTEYSVFFNPYGLDTVPQPLDEALSKVWGYASNEARHVVEGQPPPVEEATLIVHLAAACATYLSSAMR